MTESTRTHLIFHAALIAGVSLLVAGMVYLVPEETRTEQGVIINKEAAHERARDFLAEHAPTFQPQDSVSTLSIDKYGSAYLDHTFTEDYIPYLREHGLPYFTHEIELQDASDVQAQVRIDASGGRVVGYHAPDSEHVALPHEGARAREIADAFLASVHDDADSLTYRRDLSTDTDGPASTYTIGYVSNGSERTSEYGTSSVIHLVAVDAHGVSSYTLSFDLPGPFMDKARELERRAETFGTISVLLLFAFFLCAVIAAWQVLLTRSTYSLVFAIIGLGTGAVVALDTINQIPAMRMLEMSEYTAIDFTVLTFLSAIPLALIIYVFGMGRLGVASRDTSREWVTARLRSVLAPANLSSVVSISYGYTALALIVLGLVSAAESLFYSSIQIGPDDLALTISSAFPLLSVLISFAILPAVVEEIAFRYFGTAFFGRALHSMTWGSVVVALFWAAGHFAIPVDPLLPHVIMFILFGLGLAYMYKTYGLAAVLVIHYIYNATLGWVLLVATFPLNTWLIAGATVMVLSPAIVSVIVGVIGSIRRA